MAIDGEPTQPHRGVYTVPYSISVLALMPFESQEPDLVFLAGIPHDYGKLQQVMPMPMLRRIALLHLLLPEHLSRKRN